MFFPIRDDQPTLRRPVVTITLIAVNALIFLYSFMQGAKGFQIFVYQYGFIPYELVHGQELTPQIGVSVWFTMFSSMFMHGGWLHLIGNMLFLWIYGNNVEDYFGHVRFILFYLASGLAAVFLFTAFGPDSQVPLVGASGAIAGVMGAYMVLHPRARITVLIIFFFIQFVDLSAKVVLGFWFVYQLLLSFMDVLQPSAGASGGVAYLAHVGGFAFGYGLLRLLIKFKGPGGVAADRGQRIYRVHWD